MSIPYVLPEGSLSKLTCSKCKKPLSYFPIYITEGEAKPSCGRCGEPQNGGYRCEFFEEIAKNVEFPCCYKQNGCLEILLPKNVANHEWHCKFQRIACYLNCPIQWNGFANDFLEHIKKEHPTNLLTNDCGFEANFIHNYYVFKLIPYLDDYYLIKYTCTHSSPTKSILLTFTVVRSKFQHLFEDNLNCKITFEDSGRQFSHTVFVDFNAIFKINKSELDTHLKNPTAVLVNIKVLPKEDNSVTRNVNAELLRHFKCIVCMDYMIGPIYLCTTGHSICQLCKGIVEECPTCKSHIQTTRNYNLQSVISDTEFPCKYEKCPFVGKGKDIKKHQETCNFIERDCPLKELNGCQKKVLFANLWVHIYNEHNKHWYKGEVISYPLTLDKKIDASEDVFFLKYSSKLFRLNFSHRNGLLTFVAKLMNGLQESSKYRFVVDIIDTTENKNGLRCWKNFKTEEAIKIHFDTIEHLINSSFQFRMFVREN